VPLATVASVPMTPMWPERDARTACFAPGWITPSVGRPGASARRRGSASADAVLHAMTSILMLIASRKLAFWTA
jgi:hypothetical protein